MQARTPSNSEPIPLEALRDLIGIARAMYAAAKAEGAQPFNLQQLEQAGTELRRALELASKSSADTMGGRAAHMWAQRGYERLVQQITVTTALEPVMAAAVARVLRLPPGRSRREREGRRQARRVRS